MRIHASMGSISLNANELSAIDTTAPPKMSVYCSAVRIPSPIPVCPMMNENSPICARLSPLITVSVPCNPAESTTPSTMLMSHLPTMMSATSAISSPTCEARVTGLTIMPTEAKKMMEKRSLKGMASAATRCESLDPLTTTPARKAPSATERSNSSEAAMAVPSAITTTANWKSSLGQKRAILPSTHGSTRDPTTSISSTNATVLSSASARPAASSAPEVSPGPKTTGSTTKITTVARSSTMSHPVATRPPWLWYRPASVRFLMRTTVDAMLTERPSMMPASGVHPNACASA